LPPICGTFCPISQRTARKRDRSRDGLGELAVITAVDRGGEGVEETGTVGGRRTVPANTRPEVRLNELVVVEVMTEEEHLSDLVEEVHDDGMLDGTLLGQPLTNKLLLLLLLIPLLSELDLAC
jgi:hypothetical protein